MTTSFSSRILTFFLFIFYLASLLIIESCSSGPEASPLKSLALLVDANPEVALDSLRAISPQHLNSDDRVFLDLLTIKASDKSFVKHTSDSLIRNVLDYVSVHPDVDYRTEALYYGARVYHDLGDLPTAMKYYHSTLDNLNEMDEDEKDLQFEANVMSQYAKLLNDLQLYDQAIPYLERIVELDIALNDTLNFVDDCNLLGHLWINKMEYKKAHDLLSKSVAISTHTPGLSADISSMYLAVAKAHMNQLDSALLLLPNTSNFKNKNDLSTLLAFTSQILKKAGKSDSAASVARQLINLDTMTNNRHHGYEILLDHDYENVLQADSLVKLSKGYVASVKSTPNNNQNILALLQQSAYNYSLHDKKAKHAIESKSQIEKLVTIMGIIITVLVIIIISYVLKHHQKRSNKKETNKLSAKEASPSNVNLYTDDKSETNNVQTKEEIRAELLQKYNEAMQDKFSLSLKIIESNPYEKIKKCIKDKKSIPETDSCHQELQQLVFQCYPKFKTRLNILTDGSLPPHELRTIIMIKCKLRPTEISIIEAKAESTIGSRRKQILNKIMGNEISLPSKAIDAIIHIM